jgi:hypothetical protein
LPPLLQTKLASYRLYCTTRYEQTKNIPPHTRGKNNKQNRFFLALEKKHLPRGSTYRGYIEHRAQIIEHRAYICPYAQYICKQAGGTVLAVVYCT